jgi:hypothetical protein
MDVDLLTFSAENLLDLTSAFAEQSDLESAGAPSLSVRCTVGANVGEILDLRNIPRADADLEYLGGGGVNEMSPSVNRSDALTLGGVPGDGVLGPFFLTITFDFKTPRLPLPLQLSEFDCESLMGATEEEDCPSRSLSHVSEDIIMLSDTVLK